MIELDALLIAATEAIDANSFLLPRINGSWNLFCSPFSGSTKMVSYQFQTLERLLFKKTSYA